MCVVVYSAYSARRSSSYSSASSPQQNRGEILDARRCVAASPPAVRAKIAQGEPFHSTGTTRHRTRKCQGEPLNVVSSMTLLRSMRQIPSSEESQKHSVALGGQSRAVEQPPRRVAEATTASCGEGRKLHAQAHDTTGSSISRAPYFHLLVGHASTSSSVPQAGRAAGNPWPRPGPLRGPPTPEQEGAHLTISRQRFLFGDKKINSLFRNSGTYVGADDIGTGWRRGVGAVDPIPPGKGEGGRVLPNRGRETAPLGQHGVRPQGASRRVCVCVVSVNARNTTRLTRESR